MSGEDRPEGHDVVLTKGECPKCGSSKGFVTYADGHSHCYSAGCGYRVNGSEDGSEKPPAATRDFGPASELPQPLSRSPLTLAGRRLAGETTAKYGVYEYGYGGDRAVGFPYYSQNGELAGIKMRYRDKERGMPFAKAPSGDGLSTCHLFGRHVFGDRFDRTVIITEGEYDTLSVYQAITTKAAVVSVNAGAGKAADTCKANYLWLDRFQEIVLFFDNDEAGRAACEEVAKLFKVGKVKIAWATGDSLKGTPCKDASDMLQADDPGGIQIAIYAAKTWRPRGIVNGREVGSAITAPDTKALSYAYPPAMEKLQEMSGGIFAGEVVYHVAGTGVGKSTGLREIEYHLVTQGAKIAVLSFEDTLRDAAFGIMSIHASERLHLVPVPDPEDTKGRAAYDARMLKVHAEVFGAGKIELFDPETAEWSMEAILGYVRYCAKALDCNVVFIDPISFVASGIDLKADERRVLDMVAGEFAKLAKELGVALIIAHHLKRTQGVPHEEGAPTSLNELRSSGGLANFATCVIGWERNNQAEGDAFRVTQTRILKPVRRTGKSGLADILFYTESGRLIPSPIAFPPIGKPDHEGEDRAGGFAPVSSSSDY